MITMPVMFVAAAPWPQARRGLVAAGVMVARSGMAAARALSGWPVSAATLSGVDSDQPRVAAVAGEKPLFVLVIAVSARMCGTRRLLAWARRVRNEPIVSLVTG